MLTEADRLLSKSLVHNGLVSQEQVDACLQAVEKAGELGLRIALADVLVEKGFVERPALDALRKLPVRETERAIRDANFKPLQMTSDEDRKIGNLALRNGLLAQVALDQCLALQKEVAKLGAKKPLGEILVEKNFLSTDLVKSLLELQRALEGKASKSSGGSLLRQDDLFFGAIAVAKGLATREQIQEALTLQRQIFERTGLRRQLGEVLLDRRVLEPKAVQSVLEAQSERRQLAGPPLLVNPQLGDDHENRLGRVIVDNQLVTEEQIGESLEVQARLRELGIQRKIGEILILKGYLSEQAIRTMVGLQTQRRQAPARAPSRAPRRLRRVRKGAVTGAALSALGVAVLVAAGWLMKGRGTGGNEPGPPLGADRPAADARLAAKTGFAAAEELVRKGDYLGAVARYEAALALLPQDDEETRQRRARADRHRKANEALEDLIAKLGAAGGKGAERALAGVGWCRVVGASRQELKLLTPAVPAPLTRGVPWTDVAATDVFALAEQTGTAAARPLGCAYLAEDRGDSAACRRFLARVFETGSAAPAEVAAMLEHCVGRAVSPRELRLREGRLLVGNELPPAATPGERPLGPGPVFADFEEGYSAQAWLSLESTLQLKEGPDRATGGRRSLCWRIPPGKREAVAETSRLPAAWPAEARLTFWLSNVRFPAPPLEVLLLSSASDYLHASIPMPGAGWQRVELALSSMQAVGRPDPAAIRRVRVQRAPSDEPGELFFDDLAQE
ncbi:MAG: hypothetical protein HYZ53_06700 [Planctomycetes bacterium]|nr:hypothetical protein [Planctomycetota bacterium]